MKVIVISAAVLLCLCAGGDAMAQDGSMETRANVVRQGTTNFGPTPSAAAASAALSRTASTGMPRMPSIHDMILAKELELPYHAFLMNHMGLGIGNGATGMGMDAMNMGMGMGAMDPFRYEIMKKYDLPHMPYPQAYPQASAQAPHQRGRQFMDPLTSMYIADKIFDLPTPSMRGRTYSL